MITALIWAAYNEEISSITNTDIVDRINPKIQMTMRLIENYLNPIKKVILIVTGSDENLLIDEIQTMSDNGTLTSASRGTNEQAAYMIIQVSYSISNYFLSLLLIKFFLFFID